MTDGQIIEKISIENVMGIRRLTFTPQTPVILVEGTNGAGKSSFTDAGALVLGSTDDAKRIRNIVRNGESKATVIAKLTNMTVTKVWSASGKSRVDIVSNDGARFSNPVEMLKTFTGPLPFDPTKLMNQSSKEMMDTFTSMIHTDTDFEKLALLKDSIYKERTIINRQKKAVGAKRDGFHLDYPNAPDEEKSISELSEGLTTAMGIINQHAENKADKLRIDRNIREKTEMIENLRAELQTLESDKTLLTNVVESYIDPGVQEIKEEIEAVDETNKQVRYMQEKTRLVVEYDQLDEKSKELSSELDDIQKTKEWELSNAKIPIDGLTFDDDTIMFNGIPLSDCCTAERLEACVAICIGTHPNPENGVKVMFINHGNNLDAGNLKRLGDLCTREGYQVWIEMVSEKPSGTGVFIEDGEIKNGD